jgi:hypothetical protein
MNRTIKKLRALAAGLLAVAGVHSAQAQISSASFSERFGNTLNIAVGGPYFPGWGRAPYFTANYEFLVAPNLTLAPFVGAMAYNRSYFVGSLLEKYSQRLLVVGGKGTYYFDDLLRLGPSWDLYAGLSLGFVSNSLTWASWGTHSAVEEVTPFYLDVHLGAEYHITRRTGLILDVILNICPSAPTFFFCFAKRKK